MDEAAQDGREGGGFRHLLREPLLHFLFAGALLFGLDAALSGSATEAAADRTIRVTAGEVAWMRELWTRQWGRPPGEDELRGLVAAQVREAVLAREAAALGLGEDDVIVRRRLAQKLEFLILDTVRLVDPTEAELRAFHAAHPEEFREADRVSFAHVFFSSDRRADPAADARAALARIRDGGAAPETLGDPILIEPEFQDVTGEAVAAQFGAGFAEALVALEPGGWTGPVASEFGQHLVRLEAMRQAAPRPFEGVRDQVVTAWRAAQGRRANAEYLARLFAKYEIVAEESVRPWVEPLAIAPEARR